MIEVVVIAVGMCHVTNWINEYQYQVRCVTREFHLTFAAEATNVTPQQCMMQGQIAMSGWTASNPNWRIEKWRCGVAGQTANL